MKIIKTFIDDLLIIEPKLYYDKRGFFFESYNKNVFAKKINSNFVQDNESKSQRGVIRGLHFQIPPFDQTKIVRCTNGKILDVAVDIRKGSKTFGKFLSIELSSENNKQLLIPKGFAHGFQVLSEHATVNYKVDNFYEPSSDSGIIWNDKDLNIDWNLNLSQIVSSKDSKLNSFKSLKSPFK